MNGKKTYVTLLSTVILGTYFAPIAALGAQSNHEYYSEDGGKSHAKITDVDSFKKAHPEYNHVNLVDSQSVVSGYTHTDLGDSLTQDQIDSLKLLYPNLNVTDNDSTVNIPDPQRAAKNYFLSFLNDEEREEAIPTRDANGEFVETKVAEDVTPAEAAKDVQEFDSLHPHDSAHITEDPRLHTAHSLSDVPAGVPYKEYKTGEHFYNDYTLAQKAYVRRELQAHMGNALEQYQVFQAGYLNFGTNVSQEQIDSLKAQYGEDEVSTNDHTTQQVHYGDELPTDLSNVIDVRQGTEFYFEGTINTFGPEKATPAGYERIVIPGGVVVVATGQTLQQLKDANLDAYAKYTGETKSIATNVTKAELASIVAHYGDEVVTGRGTSHSFTSLVKPIIDDEVENFKINYEFYNHGETFDASTPTPDGFTRTSVLPGQVTTSERHNLTRNDIISQGISAFEFEGYKGLADEQTHSQILALMAEYGIGELRTSETSRAKFDTRNGDEIPTDQTDIENLEKHGGDFFVLGDVDTFDPQDPRVQGLAVLGYQMIVVPGGKIVVAHYESKTMAELKALGLADIATKAGVKNVKDLTFEELEDLVAALGQNLEGIDEVHSSANPLQHFSDSVAPDPNTRGLKGDVRKSEKTYVDSNGDSEFAAGSMETPAGFTSILIPGGQTITWSEKEPKTREEIIKEATAAGTAGELLLQPAGTKSYSNLTAAQKEALAAQFGDDIQFTEATEPKKHDQLTKPEGVTDYKTYSETYKDANGNDTFDSEQDLDNTWSATSIPGGQVTKDSINHVTRQGLEDAGYFEGATGVYVTFDGYEALESAIDRARVDQLIAEYGAESDFHQVGYEKHENEATPPTDSTDFIVHHNVETYKDEDSNSVFGVDHETPEGYTRHTLPGGEKTVRHLTNEPLTRNELRDLGLETYAELVGIKNLDGDFTDAQIAELVEKYGEGELTYSDIRTVANFVLGTPTTHSDVLPAGVEGVDYKNLDSSTLSAPHVAAGAEAGLLASGYHEVEGSRQSEVTSTDSQNDKTFAEKNALETDGWSIVKQTINTIINSNLEASVANNRDYIQATYGPEAVVTVTNNTTGETTKLDYVDFDQEEARLKSKGYVETAETPGYDVWDEKDVYGNVEDEYQIDKPLEVDDKFSGITLSEAANLIEHAQGVDATQAAAIETEFETKGDLPAGHYLTKDNGQDVAINIDEATFGTYNHDAAKEIEEQYGIPDIFASFDQLAKVFPTLLNDKGETVQTGQGLASGIYYSTDHKYKFNFKVNNLNPNDTNSWDSNYEVYGFGTDENGVIPNWFKPAPYDVNDWNGHHWADSDLHDHIAQGANAAMPEFVYDTKTGEKIPFEQAATTITSRQGESEFWSGKYSNGQSGTIWKPYYTSSDQSHAEIIFIVKDNTAEGKGRYFYVKKHFVNQTGILSASVEDGTVTQFALEADYQMLKAEREIPHSLTYQLEAPLYDATKDNYTEFADYEKVEYSWDNLIDESYQVRNAAVKVYDAKIEESIAQVEFIKESYSWDVPLYDVELKYYSAEKKEEKAFIQYHRTHYTWDETLYNGELQLFTAEKVAEKVKFIQDLYEWETQTYNALWQLYDATKWSSVQLAQFVRDYYTWELPKYGVQVAVYGTKEASATEQVQFFREFYTWDVKTYNAALKLYEAQKPEEKVQFIHHWYSWREETKEASVALYKAVRSIKVEDEIFTWHDEDVEVPLWHLAAFHKAESFSASIDTPEYAEFDYYEAWKEAELPKTGIPPLEGPAKAPVATVELPHTGEKATALSAAGVGIIGLGAAIAGFKSRKNAKR
ncbi:MAG: LPXTG cell wall anchor domain-containing protein [Lactobacillales bacterium]|jgi:LPXTG-motif cell wall-anchored protein|nr:LPXTG cell wall anchor domain-containing protein [Lactobacillales bacterium]